MYDNLNFILKSIPNISVITKDKYINVNDKLFTSDSKRSLNNYQNLYIPLVQDYNQLLDIILIN